MAWVTAAFNLPTVAYVTNDFTIPAFGHHVAVWKSNVPLLILNIYAIVLLLLADERSDNFSVVE
jgi:hypothetical protein